MLYTQVSAEKRTVLASESEYLPVMEAFYTIQGEGFFQGNAAYFIRLAGCNVGCSWCDVKESWNAESFPKPHVSEVVDEAARYPARLAVITGGEPLMYDLTALTDALHTRGFTVNIETSGAYPLSGNIDHICFSPKRFKKPLPEVAAAAHELKVIIHSRSDFEWAESFEKTVSDHCTLFLQPEWDRANKMMPQIAEYIKQHPQWRVSLQTHKYMNIP